MFFSENATMAHIWCQEAENPLFRARKADFPELWPWLEVGAVVFLSGPADAVQQFAESLEIKEADEDV